MFLENDTISFCGLIIAQDVSSSWDILSGIISGCESSVWTEGFFTEILRG